MYYLMMRKELGLNYSSIKNCCSTLHMSDSILSFHVSLNTLSKKETYFYASLWYLFYDNHKTFVLLQKPAKKKVAQIFISLDLLAMNGIKSKFVNLPQSETILNVIERSTYTKRKQYLRKILLVVHILLKNCLVFKSTKIWIMILYTLCSTHSITITLEVV